MNLFVIAGMVGPWQVVIIVFALVLLFGGKKIPELMKGLGQGMKEFKKATDSEEKEKDTDEKESKNK
ncbi:twin-arginine translocase TatA/TatE family subunit [Ancylomarina euxinus]|uniref:Sec-independent protein translocase protein TatA n=1 Tax=Ancylomarina euxinus TaxID=2283627 RepID=A0A425XYS3_9BACT|nr:twin-arginine translocase TatA/TatE family subunit [Ancylomarina euxinus]MCZ4695645.1 twin-arginine translocase TatA/TatE family subunit [Ancylomarina euxinus]MUP16051.1 twin-arginine translocase TatA/TatE family subunit [Ancylomarina euxinus]RRG20295.1 twin-arginine translocase TatA/TatE family subunit [Ancylomarina euxinus]